MNDWVKFMKLIRNNDNLFLAVMFTVVTVFVIGSALLFDYVNCNSRWKYSKMKYKWGPTSGCLIEVKPDIYIPASAVREIPINLSK